MLRQSSPGLEIISKYCWKDEHSGETTGISSLLQNFKIYIKRYALATQFLKFQSFPASWKLCQPPAKLQFNLLQIG